MDQRLRELERRWRASSATDDAAAYLAERLRREPAPVGAPDVGAPPEVEGLIGRGPPLSRLERERRQAPGPAPSPVAGAHDLRTRLAVAAHCGDPIACAALGQVAPPTDPLAGWTRGLAGISRWGAVAAAFGAVRLVLHGPTRVTWHTSLTPWTPTSANLALLLWLQAPSAEGFERLSEEAAGSAVAEARLRHVSQREPQRSVEERLASARLSVVAGVVRRAAEVGCGPEPDRLLAEAIACAAIAVRGPLTSLPQAEAMFIAIGCMPRDGPVFGPVGDAEALAQVRETACQWALRGLLSKAP